MSKTLGTSAAVALDEFKNAANGLMLELINEWDLHAEHCDWVGGEVGGIMECDSYIYVSLQDMVYCIKNAVEKEAYLDWQDYNVKANAHGFDILTLKEWFNDAPRVSDEVFERLESLHEEIYEAIEAEKQRLTNGGF